MIRAQIRTDDGTVKAEFDALPWFEQASNDDLVALSKKDWRNSGAADHVALFFDGRLPDVTRFLADFRKKMNQPNVGYEVGINALDVLTWISGRRPLVLSDCFEEPEAAIEIGKSIRAALDSMSLRNAARTVRSLSRVFEEIHLEYLRARLRELVPTLECLRWDCESQCGDDGQSFNTIDVVTLKRPEGDVVVSANVDGYDVEHHLEGDAAFEAWREDAEVDDVDGYTAFQLGCTVAQVEEITVIVNHLIWVDPTEQSLKIAPVDAGGIICASLERIVSVLDEAESAAAADPKANAE